MIGLGSSSTLGIGLIVELRDKFTANANNISASINNMDKSVKASLNNTYNQMTLMGAGMTLVGVGITKSMLNATGEASNFQKIMLNIKALGQLSNEEMTKLSSIAQTLGPKYGKDASAVAAGMEDLVKAGLGAKDIPQVMEAMLQTALGASEKLEGETGVAARMTDMLMAWGFQSRQAGRVGDILARASVQSTVSFNDLAESMKYSQDILKGLNLSFEESVALMAVLGNAGIKASMSGTSLGNAWREITIALGGGSKKKTSALKQMGLTKEDLMDEFGNIKGPLEILDKIKKGIQGMGSVQRQNVLTDLFGVRGKRGVNPLIDFLTKGPSDKFMGMSLSDMVKDLTNNSAGSNVALVEEKMKGAAFQADKLKANWENFKIAVGNALLPALQALLPVLSKIVNGFTALANTTLGKWLITGIALFGAILVPMGIIYTITGLIGKGLLALRGGLTSMQTAGTLAWNSLTGSSTAYLTTLREINAQQQMLNAQMATNMSEGLIMSNLPKGQRFNKAGSVIDEKTGRVIIPANKVPENIIRNNTSTIQNIKNVTPKLPEGLAFNKSGKVIEKSTGRFVSQAALRTTAKEVGGGVTAGLVEGAIIGEGMTAVTGGLSAMVASLGSAVLGIGAFMLALGAIEGLVTLFTEDYKPDDEDQSLFAQQARQRQREKEMQVVAPTPALAPYVPTPEDVANYGQFYGVRGVRPAQEMFDQKSNPDFNKFQWAGTKPKETNVHIYIDGKKAISKKIQDDMENDAVHHFGLNQ